MTSLDGLLVADLSRVAAGPLATMVLGDLGAEVIKIERPGAGDETRSWRPPERDGTSTYYLGLNRNKRSIALDLDAVDDGAVARAIIDEADVLVENFRPGTMARFGLDHDTLRRSNPGLVHCSITGFGAEGEAADLAGYDLLVQAMSGLMSVTGDPDGEPMKVGVALLDQVCGLYAAVGILAALRHRDATGDGQHIEVSLFDAALAGLMNQASAYTLAGEVPGRLGNRHPSIAPYQTFHGSDGGFVVAVGNETLWRRLCAVIGAEDLILDERFASNEARVSHIDALEQRLEEVFAERPVAHWVSTLREAGIPAGPVNDVAEAFETAERLGLDPYWTDDAGRDLVRGPLRMSATPPRLAEPPPDLGAHDAEVRERFSPGGTRTTTR